MLGWTAPPDFDTACRESDALAGLLEALGVEVVWAGEGNEGAPGAPTAASAGAASVPAPPLTLDSIYVRDPGVLTDRGYIPAHMGKEARRGEAGRIASTLRSLGFTILPAVAEPGTLEGGDVAWLSPRELAVGRGYRTNDQGIARLRKALPAAVELPTVPLPHYRGPENVFHLMSFFSPVADDAAVVFSPLMPVPFREHLVGRGWKLIEVPEEELDTQGCNVLAVAPGVVIAVEGNPETRRRMEAAGVQVHTYRGVDISLKGGGGPTCLTRPLEREFGAQCPP